MPIGTLMKKIHSHDRYSVRMPPASRPTAAPPTAIAAQTARALARSAPSRKVVVTIDRAAGDTIAPPRPWRARATISHSEEGASPFSSEAPVKTTTPATNSRRRPMKSAARPPSSRKPPKASVYAFTTHWRELAEKPRSSWIDGRATLTTVPSRTTMNWAMQTTTSASQRRSWTEAGSGAAVLTGRLLDGKRTVRSVCERSENGVRQSTCRRSHGRARARGPVGV